MLNAYPWMSLQKLSALYCRYATGKGSSYSLVETYLYVIVGYCCVMLHLHRLYCFVHYLLKNSLRFFLDDIPLKISFATLFRENLTICTHQKRFGILRLIFDRHARHRPTRASSMLYGLRLTTVPHRKKYTGVVQRLIIFVLA